MRQCPFPVRSTDSRRPYRAGSMPGWTLGLGMAAALLCFADFGHAASVPPNAGTRPVTSKSIVGWAKGRVLVSPRPGLSDKEFTKVLKSQNGKSMGRFRHGNTYMIELPPGVDEVTAVQALKKDRRLKFAELDVAMAAAGSVNDPGYANSWALPKIAAPTAWDSGTGNGVTIAILDSGMDSTHPDLAANYVPGWNFYDNSSDTSETNGHGTWVAGVAAMVGNNTTGSAGVAYSAKIMPVRIASPDGYAYASTMAQALYWAADNGARVANISYSGVPGNSTVDAAAQYLRSKGGVVVVSAGNTGALENIPADDAMLVVASTQQDDTHSSFSSYGPYVDLAAPGYYIYSTAVGGGYGNYWGTSFSSPVVAGTVALMLSANSRLTPADIDKIVESTALDLGTAGVDPYFGYGRVDAGKAVAMAKSYVATDTQAPTIGIASPTGGSVSGVVPVDVSYSDNVGAVRAELYVNGTRVATDDVAPFAFAWDTAGYADGPYQLAVKAYDAAGNVGTSASVAVNLGNDTIAPVIGSVTPGDGATISPSKQAVAASATDNQGVFKINLAIDGKEVALAYGSSVSYSWNTRKAAKGAHTLTVRAWDAAGNAASRSVTVYR